MLLVALLVCAYSVRDEYRTLASLRQIEGANAYVMDYYGSYHLDQIRDHGTDTSRLEDHLIEVRFSDGVAYVMQSLKGYFVREPVRVVSTEGHRCSTIAYRNGRGETFFGRNFDWHHNASLILRVHGDEGVESVAVIDLAYLGLDRDDLHKTWLLQRIRLLFAPYYLMDGMNAQGLAIADMSLDGSQPPQDATKPNLLHSTAMRLVLDTASTTDEAIETLGRYNIHFGDTPVHYLISDAHGDSAVVEFLEGHLRVTRLPAHWQVCTNSQVWDTDEEQRDQACDRYRLASDQLQALSPNVEAKGVMDIMSSVAVEDRTMWTSVYNLTAGELLFVHRKSSGVVHEIPVAFAD